jgi:hypothetical protein
MRGQAKAFDSNAEITAKEIFGIDATTPGVIAAKEAVVIATAFEENIVDTATIVVRAGESVRAPKADVPLAISVPFRARRWSNLLHLFARIFRPREGH